MKFVEQVVPYIATVNYKKSIYPKLTRTFNFKSFQEIEVYYTWRLNSIVINFDSNFVSSYRWNWNYTLMFAINRRFKLKTRRIVIGFQHISWNYLLLKGFYSLMFDFIVFKETLSSSFNVMLCENIYVIINSRYIYFWKLWL